MVCDAYGYACYINDRLVQKKKHRLHSLVNAVATPGYGQDYLKMVNVDDEEKEIQISLDWRGGGKRVLDGSRVGKRPER